MKTKFAFLTSTAFYAIILTSASGVLIDPNFINQPWYVTLGKFFGLLGAQFTVVRTVDRHSDKKVEAAMLSTPVQQKVIQNNQPTI